MHSRSRRRRRARASRWRPRRRRRPRSTSAPAHFPDVAVDAAGTAHIVVGPARPRLADRRHDRLLPVPAGATACACDPDRSRCPADSDRALAPTSSRRRPGRVDHRQPTAAATPRTTTYRLRVDRRRQRPSATPQAIGKLEPRTPFVAPTTRSTASTPAGASSGCRWRAAQPSQRRPARRGLRHPDDGSSIGAARRPRDARRRDRRRRRRSACFTGRRRRPERRRRPGTARRRSARRAATPHLACGPAGTAMIYRVPASPARASCSRAASTAPRSAPAPIASTDDPIQADLTADSQRARSPPLWVENASRRTRSASRRRRTAADLDRRRSSSLRGAAVDDLFNTQVATGSRRPGLRRVRQQRPPAATIDRRAARAR